MPIVRGGTVLSSDDGPPETPVRLQSPPPSPTPATSALGTMLPPLSSDGLIYTSPIVGTRAERKAKSYSKGQKKKKETLAKRALSAEDQKHAVFDGVLHELADNGFTFGDLMLYVFDPIYKQRETRWNGFFRKRGLATSILGFWVAPENSETAREEVTEWAGDFVANLAQDAARDITASKYLQTGERAVNGEFVDSFSITKLHKYLHQHAKTAMKVFSAFATSARNLRKDLPARVLKRATALALLGEYSHKNNFSRRIMGLYLYAAGAQRQTISVMAHLGISESYQNLTRKPRFTITRRGRQVDPDAPLPPTPPSTPFTLYQPYVPPDSSVLAAKIEGLRTIHLGTLRQLSDSMRDMARSVAATGLYAASYDNINMVFRAAEQLVGKNDSQENGTCSTIWPLWKAALEDMSIDELNKAFGTAAPLSIKDILLSAPELELMDKCLKHSADESLPVTADQIELHQTPLHPTPAWNIDQSTIIGNDEVVDAIHTELGVKGKSHWSRVVKFFAGDQLSIARLRSLLNIRAGHEGGYSGYGWGGHFHSITHIFTAARSSFLRFPRFAPVGTWFFVSLYARVLHCLLLETNKTTLDECADSIETFTELESIAAAIQKKYANAELNASLLLRDALISREFTDAIKAGDSGRIVLVLKVFACSYRGNGRTKYAHEMLHLIHNLTKVWPVSIRNIVLKNWLVNPTGNPFSWVEVDLMQEHMNFWIKTIYQAHGSSASWEWLGMISPCISVLRRLSTMITKALGSDQGTKHQPADLKDDIALLMASLRGARCVSNQGRVFAKDDGAPTPDVILIGAQQLTDSSSNPLTEYNTMFKRLQSRRQLFASHSKPASVPSTGSPMVPNPVPETISVDVAADFGGNSDEDGDGDENSDIDIDGDLEAEQLSAFERVLDEDDGPTLTRDTAADVALDMDGGDNGFFVSGG
ncbi:hypothetical protein B0H14DRAFT_3092571 [Mycena olivaceomarginata]|nr:hypothetical protein B0H14DRAFT_3092571 [Mycena olivaceomarginata]